MCTEAPDTAPECLGFPPGSWGAQSQRSGNKLSSPAFNCRLYQMHRNLLPDQMAASSVLLKVRLLGKLEFLQVQNSFLSHIC